jgi:hypothetical protein
MTIQQSLNRGFNLLATSITGLAGFAFAPEMFVEKDMPDKIDDALLFLLGLVAIIWYRRSENRYTRSALPVAFVVIGLAIKLTGLFIELDDAEAFGDDIGGLILFVLSAGLIIQQFRRTGELLATP